MPIEPLQRGVLAHRLQTVRGRLIDSLSMGRLGNMALQPSFVGREREALDRGTALSRTPSPQGTTLRPNVDAPFWLATQRPSA
jgi:hypothetical protein